VGKLVWDEAQPKQASKQGSATVDRTTEVERNDWSNVAGIGKVNQPEEIRWGFGCALFVEKERDREED